MKHRFYDIKAKKNITAKVMKMTAKPHSEWPFNYWVHALMFRPELEPEFHDWDKISYADAREFEKCQPEIFQRHHLDQNNR